MKRDFLKEVILDKQKALKEAKRRYPQDELRMKLEEPHIYRPFKAAVSYPGKLNIIGEIKKSSPSEGVLRENFDPVRISRLYQNAGCSAISVLTEEKYFSGKIAHLNQVRKIVSLPILRKDFIFDPYQLYESKFFGADCVLLIAELLKDGRLSEFLHIAKQLELDCLVEVNGLEELKYALGQGCEIIGINNRNLHSLKVDPDAVLDLIKSVPEGRTVVMESGISRHSEYLDYLKLKVNALLIGSAFMKSDDIKKKVSEIVNGKEPRRKASAGRNAPMKKRLQKKKSVRK